MLQEQIGMKRFLERMRLGKDPGGRQNLSWLLKDELTGNGEDQYDFVI